MEALDSGDLPVCECSNSDFMYYLSATLGVLWVLSEGLAVRRRYFAKAQSAPASVVEAVVEGVKYGTHSITPSHSASLDK